MRWSRLPARLSQRRSVLCPLQPNAICASVNFDVFMELPSTPRAGIISGKFQFRLAGKTGSTSIPLSTFYSHATPFKHGAGAP